MNTKPSSPAVTVQRRLVVACGLALALGLVSNPVRAQTAGAATELRIGFQKYSTLTLMKTRGDLDKRLAAQGVAVRWIEFPGGPQMLEALNVGSIDFGNVGEAPPIFAQAAGADFVYVANEPPSPTAEAVVVRKDSPLKSVADLKGRRVALNKGSNVHFLFVKLMDKAGLKPGDVEIVFLPPADARAAFERGSVDAWVIWDPFLAAIQKQTDARVLADGSGLVSNYIFYVAGRKYAEANPRIIALVVDDIARVGTWATQEPKAVAGVIAPLIGLELAIVETSVRRYAYGVKPIDAAALAEQQRVADVFFGLNLIPKPIRTADAVARAR